MDTKEDTSHLPVMKAEAPFLSLVPNRQNVNQREAALRGEAKGSRTH
ncbi:unnamed protein product, partial [Amoebophrya sp. A25]|eukprot:GSA25T00006380001.1